MVRSYRLVFDVDAPPENVLEVAGDPRLFTSFWGFVERLDLDRVPPFVRFKFKKFGLTAIFEYDLEIERKGNKVVYTGKGKGKSFGVTVEAAARPGGGSKVVLEVYYAGPYESFSGPFLREFAEGIAKGLQAVATKLGGKREVEAGLKDASYIAHVIASGRLLTRRVYQAKDLSDVQKILSFVNTLSKGRLVFARLLAGEVCVRLLVKDGRVLDALIQAGASSAEGPEAIERTLDVLPGKTVEILVIEAPKE